MDAPGRCFDELSVGDVVSAGPRVISREDIAAFADLSGDRTALHTDEAYAASTPLGGLVAHGALTLSAATGLAYESQAFEGTVLAFKGMDVSFERPVFPGDTVSLELTVEGLKAAPRGDRGTTDFAVRVLNQKGRRVLSGTWTLVLRTRGS